MREQLERRIVGGLVIAGVFGSVPVHLLGLGPDWLGLAMFLGAAAVLVVHARLRPHLYVRRPAERVLVDDEAVARVLGDGRIERIAWRDVARVSVVTTADGPRAEDAFFVLESEDGKTGCAVPNALAAPLVERIVKLPGFDHEAMIRAMASSEAGLVRCWTRPGAAPPRAATERS